MVLTVCLLRVLYGSESDASDNEAPKRAVRTKPTAKKSSECYILNIYTKV